MADPYSILGVARGASEKEIKSAYRKLAKQLHPDTNRDNPKAAARFSEVTRAYDVLGDKDKRPRFDRGEIDIDGNPSMSGFGGGGGFGGGQAGFRPGGGFEGGEGIDLGDIFDGLFGGRGGGGGFGGGQARGRPAARGATVQYKLGVSLVMPPHWRHSESRWQTARRSICGFRPGLKMAHRCGWRAKARLGRAARETRW